jgi:glycerophosphoryl diester phosphodiesterase
MGTEPIRPRSRWPSDILAARKRAPKPANPWRRERTMVWAHRGYSARNTENTIASFEAAVAAGADGIELDVRLCGSGELVVFHDDDLRRLAGRGEQIDKISFARLRAVELDGGPQVPTLEEVFEAVGPDIAVNVEIKSPGIGRAGAVVARAVESIERSAAAERVLISSFDPMALLQVKRYTRKIATAFLFHKGEPPPVRTGLIAPLFLPRAVHPEHVLVNAERVETWHRQGWAVNVWTVDDPLRLRELAAMGVDGIFANDPHQARIALEAETPETHS